MKSRYAIVFVLLALHASTAFAQNGPKSAYQATFEIYATGAGTMTNTQWSDGRGHTRTDQVVAGRKNATIMDFPKRVAYSLQEDTKTAMRLPMNETAYRQDPDYMKKQGWQSLGSKVIEGHPCNGWQLVTDGHTTQVWTGTDTDCTVLTLQDGKPVMKLLSYQRTNPPAALFTVPANYKVLEIPTGVGTSPGATGSQDWKKYLPSGASSNKAAGSPGAED